MNKAEHIPMTITAEFIVSTARDVFHAISERQQDRKLSTKERKYHAINILEGIVDDNHKPALSRKKIFKVLRGDAYLIGDSTKGVGYKNEIDYAFKYNLEKDMRGRLAEATKEITETFVNVIETICQPSPAMQKIKERREKMESGLKNSMASKSKGIVKIGGYNVPKNLVEDYMQGIRYTRSMSAIAMSRMEPVLAQKALALRIQKHKEIFKSIGLKYHLDNDFDDPKPDKKDLFKPIGDEHKKSMKFANELEKYIEKQNPELSKENAIRRMKYE